MKKIVQLLILTLFINHKAYSMQNVISKIYCSIFGNKNVSAENMNKVRSALKILGIKNPEAVAIKQMNGVGPAFARFDLSSFTAFGIWLNEKYLSTLSEDEKLFDIYHEASHYAQKHHQKILLGSTLFFLVVATLIVKLNTSLDFEGLIKNGALIGTETLGTILSYLYALTLVSKNQEKQADILAAQSLIKAGMKNVVEEHIENLKAVKNNTKDDWWWYSPQKRVTYLESLLNFKK